MNGAESLVKAAVSRGVEVCFGNFGTTELTLVAALDAAPGIRAVPALFEGVCTGSADGYGRIPARLTQKLFVNEQQQIYSQRLVHQ